MLYLTEKSVYQNIGVGFGLLLLYLATLGGLDARAHNNVCNNVYGYLYLEQGYEGRTEEIYKDLDTYICNADSYYRDHQVVLEEDTIEQIEEEVKEGEMELLAQLIEAEAGNQDLIGKILVGDVVMNRCRKYMKSVEEVIFTPGQFSCIEDGGFDAAAWYISEESFEAARRAYTGDGIDDEILFFTAGDYNPYCTPLYQYGDHYFGY